MSEQHSGMPPKTREQKAEDIENVKNALERWLEQAQGGDIFYQLPEGASTATIDAVITHFNKEKDKFNLYMAIPATHPDTHVKYILFRRKSL